MLEEALLQSPRGFLAADGAATGDVQHVHDFAVDIELQLVRCGIADAHRTRSFVAAQPTDVPFGQPPLARNAVHDLDLRRGSGYGAQEPIAPA